jgi:hypothetical protein
MEIGTQNKSKKRREKKKGGYFFFHFLFFSFYFSFYLARLSGRVTPFGHFHPLSVFIFFCPAFELLLLSSSIFAESRKESKKKVGKTVGVLGFIQSGEQK